MDNKYHDYYSKIKDVFIELPGFSFFHSPSGRFRNNPKMVGRERVKKKLYGILTNAETKTGSYIITGFRGVGKTSLVNQVINKLQPRGVILKQALLIIITLVIIHLINTKIVFIHLIKTKIIYITILYKYINVYIVYICLLIFSTLFLFYSNKLIRYVLNSSERFYKNQDGKEKNTLFLIFKKIKNDLISIFILDFSFYKKSNAFRIYCILLYSLLLELFIFFFWEIKLNFASLVLIYLGIITISYILAKRNKIRNLLLKLLIEITPKRIHAILLKLLSKESNKNSDIKSSNYLKQFVNHSQKVFVRLSFPQHTINSKDILKSLAQNMYKDYRRYSGFNRWVSKFLIFSIVYIITFICYYNSAVYDSCIEIKDYYNVSDFFPSQGLNNNTSEKNKKVYALLGNDFLFFKKDQDIIKSYKKSPIMTYSEVLGTSTITNSYQSLQAYTLIIDYYISYLYNKLHTFIIPDIGIFNSSKPLFPRYPDFFFFFFLMLSFFIVNLVSRLGYKFGFITNGYINRLLKDLNNRCIAEIQLETQRTQNLGIKAPLLKFIETIGISSRQTKNLTYPIADARDIEQDLIYIFDQLDRVPRILAPPEFVFIFDELDKVEVLNSDTADEILESERIRKKREIVSGIMASMKIFFTTAKAKFIFIAGREMYDASLADSSDRESYLGSIFHDIIYVSSLYKDPYDDHSNISKKPIDITYFTEKYVCGRLIPENSHHKNNLEGYSNYLKEQLKFESKPDLNTIEYKRKVYKLKKTISIINVFINYIAFRSKGSPMNMVKLFEDFVEEFPNKRYKVFNDRDKEKLILGYSNPKSYFLTFDFHAQYRISLVADIFRPYILNNGLYLKNLSDKILVSTSYLLDHIYKFHEFGFSWKNLELLPEIIDINRAPLLRRHIENIITFLSDSSIKKVDNGFVNFKFHRKVIEEINFLSKQSDAESAIFNFTLDESYTIKKHYSQRLQKLSESYEQFKSSEAEFVSSKTFLEVVLGDLHFFDKEYDEAILYYTEASQKLKKMSIDDKLSLSQSFFYTQIMLKEALVFERLNTYGTALIKYSELVELIRSHGSKLKKLGEEDSNNRKAVKGKKNLFKKYDLQKKTKDNRSDFHFAKSMYENFSIMFLSILAKLVNIENIGKQGITLKDSRRADRDFHSVYDYLKKDEKYLIKVEYHLQKGDILFYKNGLLYKDYNRASETLQLRGYNSIPDGGYRDYNAPFSAYEEYLFGLSLAVHKLNDNFLKDLIDDSSLDNPKIGSDKIDVLEIKKYENFTEVLFKKLRDNHKGEGLKRLENDLIKYIIPFLKFQKDSYSQLNISHNTWNIIARLLSAVGDCLLITCPNPSIKNLTKKFKKGFSLIGQDILEYLKSNDKSISKYTSKGKRVGQCKEFSRTELALIYFAASAKCYERANEIRNSAFQNKKILYTIKSLKKYFKIDTNLSNTNHFLSELTIGIIELLNKNRDLIIYPEFSKAKNLTKPLNLPPSKLYNELREYYRFSYNTEVKMTILHWYDLYICDFKNSIFFSKNKNPDFSILLDKIPINSYSSVNDQMVRMFELRFKDRLNRKIFLDRMFDYYTEESSFKEKIIEYWNKLSKQDHIIDDLDWCEQYFPVDNHIINDFSRKFITIDSKVVLKNLYNKKKRDEIQFLITDSIFCNLRIIGSIQLNEISYIKGYSYLGDAYFSLGWWVELWNHFFRRNQNPEENKESKERKELQDMIGEHEIHYVDNPEYAYQQALSHYYKCINMHNEGSTYKTILNNMYFTEGDFHDDNQHYCATIERFLINNGKIRNRIEFIKKFKIKNDNLFEKENIEM
ncbi:ATP-binding protein [Dokdonia sp.]|uniref:ATP-binding protein n=1 Tax=Dokdonia sp. TaxID=2024995 RepID=UPI00326540FE